MKLSVAIITKNEEDRLPKTLEAVKDLADEIVVVDSGSNFVIENLEASERNLYLLCYLTID